MRLMVRFITVYFCFSFVACYSASTISRSFSTKAKEKRDPVVKLRDDEVKLSRTATKILTLSDAILLAVRENPNVQTSRLNYVMEKFNLAVQEWQFKPHFAFQITGTVGKSISDNQPYVYSQNFNAQPSISMLAPYGTQLTAMINNYETTHYNPALSIQIMQPLMRGFGKPIVEAALNNARDSEVISRLSVEGVLRATVSIVISAYLDVVAAEKMININQDALLRAEQSVEQTKSFIKAGHKAGNELVTVQANVASAKSQLANARNNFLQARSSLLTAIGLDPNLDIDFAPLDVDALVKKYHLPNLIDTKQLILKNDIQYQTDQITLHGATSRSLLVAQDSMRWQLNLTANAVSGGGTGGGQNSGVDSLINGANQNESIGLTLQIPIDDRTLQQSAVNAKIALKEAEIALQQEKWNRETSAINGWNLMHSEKQALDFAEAAEKLQASTYHISYEKYLHGLIDSLELQTAQLQLIQAQQMVLAARISYLKALVNLDFLIGHTLKTWDISVRL